MCWPLSSTSRMACHTGTFGRRHLLRGHAAVKTSSRKPLQSCSGRERSPIAHFSLLWAATGSSAAYNGCFAVSSFLLSTVDSTSVALLLAACLLTVRFPTPGQLEKQRGVFRGEMADTINKAYMSLYFDQAHDLRAIAPGDTETFAERAFAATATAYKASRDLHGHLWQEALMDRWTMLTSMCGVERIDRRGLRQDQDQAQAHTYEQEEWEFVN